MAKDNKPPSFPSIRKKEPDLKSDEKTVVESSNLLQKYVLNGQSKALLEQMANEEFIMGNMVLRGQSTIIFSQPNMGKTLTSLALLIEAKQENSDSYTIYYINADDHFKGMAEKIAICEENNINMLAPGHNKFEASDLLKLLKAMSADGTAADVVIILDTVKKFTDPMQKGQAREFWSVIRVFVSNGGTVVALAHANKHLGPDGRPIYAGTSDSVDDVDCAYTLRALETNSNQKIKLVEFENIKNRGNVALTATYQYSVDKELSYRDLLDSVEFVDGDTAAVLQDGDLQHKTKIVDAIIHHINVGTNQKKILVDATAESTGSSKRSTQKILEEYTGDDPAKHKWNFKREHRGAQVFFLLGSDDEY